MFRFFFKGLGWLFVACMVMGLVGAALHPQSAVRPAQKASPEEDAAGTDIMTRAYAVGRTMSQAGATKPSSAQVDAMSRRMQAKMGDKHPQGWFKQYFEAGFWQGWKGRQVARPCRMPAKGDRDGSHERV